MSGSRSTPASGSAAEDPATLLPETNSRSVVSQPAATSSAPKSKRGAPAKRHPKEISGQFTFSLRSPCDAYPRAGPYQIGQRPAEQRPVGQSADTSQGTAHRSTSNVSSVQTPSAIPGTPQLGLFVAPSGPSHATPRVLSPGHVVSFSIQTVGRGCCWSMVALDVNSAYGGAHSGEVRNGKQKYPISVLEKR